MADVRPVKIAILSCNHGHAKGYYHLANDRMFDLVAVSTQEDSERLDLLDPKVPRYKSDAELYEAQKAAEAILLKGKAEAEAIEMKAVAMQKYGQAAMLEMVVDKLPDVARAIGEPLSQTEKIVLFGEGAATGLTRDVTGSMLQTFEAMKASVGLDIPQMLKTVSTGGLVGRNVETQATDTTE